MIQMLRPAMDGFVFSYGPALDNKTSLTRGRVHWDGRLQCNRWVLIDTTSEAMGSIIVWKMIVSKVEARENKFELKLPEALRKVP